MTVYTEEVPIYANQSITQEVPISTNQSITQRR